MTSATATLAAGPLTFTDESMCRRVHSEGVLLAGGGRALLLQLAHPSVAQGVAEHSRFRQDRTGRLLRTLRLSLALVFGDEAQAAAAAASINRRHESIAGAGYSATDPALLLWVWATLVDTTLAMHSLLVRPLSDEEAEAYLADMRRVGQALGIAPALLPASMPAFRAYFENTAASLEVSPIGRALASQVFDSPLLLRPVMLALRALTAATLPTSLRDALGLKKARLTSLALRVVPPAVRSLLPLVPRARRRPPAFLLPQARL